MGKTNKCNLREDETLAEVVKKCQCLYDKSFPGYKERDQCKCLESCWGIDWSWRG